MSERYDVIVVGAGPAGLAVGSALAAKGHKVLVLEKNLAGQTDRFWFVPPDVVDPSVQDYAWGGVKRFLANTFGGAKLCWNAKLHPAYPYIDEERILPHWVEAIGKAGSEVVDKCEYLGHSVGENGVSVRTSRGNFSCRLLVDASGYDSPILKKYKIKRDGFYWWSVFGCIAEHPDGLGDMQVGDYMLWQTFSDTNKNLNASLRKGRPVFEYEILDDRRSFPLLLYLTDEIIPYDKMAAVFEHLIREEPTTKNFHNIKMQKLKYGWYPSGGVSQDLARERVMFIGDAGCWTTPCGWGMGFILQNYQIFANRVSEALIEDRLDQGSLEDIPRFRLHERREIVLNSLATHFLSNAKAPMLDRFVNLFNTLDPIYCEKIFTLAVTGDDIKPVAKALFKEFSLTELLEVIPKEDYRLILKEGFAELGEAAKDELKSIWHHLVGKNEPKDPENGFNFEVA